MSNATYALITGGSQGIGRAMAFECASRGINLVLVALPNDFLTQTAEELRASFPQLQVRTHGADLTREDAPARVHAWTKAEGLTIQYLINNAGFGRSGMIESTSLSVYESMMRLNNQVMVSMIYHFLPDLKSLPQAHILNMSSMEATLPLPYKAVYTGTKHFVYGMSLALREELRETSVKVSVVCPGPTITNEEGLKRIQAHGQSSKLIVKMPDEVAAVAIAGMLSGQGVIIPGSVNKGIIGIMKHIPTSLKMNILERMFRKYKHDNH